nr:EOG090X0DK3 [Sida crystallina]
MSEFTIQVADSLRKFESNSPRSSPRGNRSPVIPRQDSTGTLKTTISLGKTPSIVHTGPFYLHKELPGDSELTGATNLMAYYNLEHSYNKFSGKKLKDSLSSFLPNLPGTLIDAPGSTDNSSLRSVIDKPPIGGKELTLLNGHQLAGFRLHPGQLQSQYLERKCLMGYPCSVEVGRIKYTIKVQIFKRKKNMNETVTKKKREGEIGLESLFSKTKKKKHKLHLRIDREEQRKRDREKKLIQSKKRNSPELPTNC